jgi:prepilin-type N-terminal cleavage/methylation domain-containing protein
MKEFFLKKAIIQLWRNNSGVTLLELMVSVSIFSLVMVMAATIFQNVISGQRTAVAAESLQENIRYDFEKIGKDIRMAKKVTNHNCLPSGVVYWNNNGIGDKLRFVNYKNQCTEYSLRSGQIYIAYPDSADTNLKNGLPLTPLDITINSLYFKIIDSSAKVQAQITVKAKMSVMIKGASAEVIDLQTTLSSRTYP